MTRNTTADPTYDILNLSIAALTGPAAGSGIVGMEGTWSASGGFFGMYTGSTELVAQLYGNRLRRWIHATIVRQF